ncbi:MAG TPA: hypothetical protein VKZ76_07145 [Edaphocola sp.]|nr:hypothetical protein [Edaphocola sp.]
MKKLRLMSSAAMLAFLSIGAMTFVSCTDDTECEVGYEGKDCNTEVRQKFIGNWTAQDTEVGGSQLPTYTASIAASNSGIDKLNIGGFSGLPSNGGFSANVVVTADGMTFRIPVQEPDNDGYQVYGQGTINAAGNTITVQYTIKQVSTQAEISYTGTWTK